MSVLSPLRYGPRHCYRGYEQGRKVTWELLGVATLWSWGKSKQPKAYPNLHMMYFETHPLFFLLGCLLFHLVCYELILNDILGLTVLQCLFSL